MMERSENKVELAYSHSANVLVGVVWWAPASHSGRCICDRKYELEYVDIYLEGYQYIYIKEYQEVNTYSNSSQTLGRNQSSDTTDWSSTRCSSTAGQEATVDFGSTFCGRSLWPDQRVGM